MLVVLTNDDGIAAVGLKVLTLVARGLGSEIAVVAPGEDRSGQSQAITVAGPVECEGRPDAAPLRRYAVRGTPADCARLVAGGWLGQKPDLLMAGVNHGPNLGEDIYASGTVGAARLAACRKIPAVAVSSLSSDWAWVAKTLLRYLPLVAGWAVAWPGVVFNLNLPPFGGQIARWTRLSRGWFEEQLEVGDQGAGRRDAVRFVRRRLPHTPFAAEDASAVTSGMVSVTPLAVWDGVDIWEMLGVQPGEPLQAPAVTWDAAASPRPVWG